MSLRKPNKSSSSYNSYESDIESSTMNSSIPVPPRSESMAYSVSPATDAWSKLTYHIRYNTKVFVGGVGLILVVLLFILDGMDGGRSASNGGLRL
jgi:hypothetical protein